MACARVLQQQGQPQGQQLQHSRQWGPESPRNGAPRSGLASSGRDVGPCRYRILNGPGAGTTCKRPDHSASNCHHRLDDLHRERFGPGAIPPHWPTRLQQGTARPIQLHPPRLGPFPTARAGPCVSNLCAYVDSSLGASEVLCVGVAATASLVLAFADGLGTNSAIAPLSLTLDSGASSCFFRDYTDLTLPRTSDIVALIDPLVGPKVVHITTTLPCRRLPLGFSQVTTPPCSPGTWWVSVTSTTSVDKPVACCPVGATGAPLATFHREPGSGLYSLHTGSHHTGSGQVMSGQVAA
ncbi:unnamed protein product, partial [Closterium sp. NIES-53]